MSVRRALVGHSGCTTSIGRQQGLIDVKPLTDSDPSLVTVAEWMWRVCPWFH